jgi:hypothetical protein
MAGIEISANQLLSQQPNSNETGASSYNVNVNRQNDSYILFDLTMAAAAFPAGYGFLIAAGPKFTKTTYTLPTGATLVFSDVSSSNTSLDNVNETSAIAYTSLLQMLSEVPTIISRMLLTFSNQADIGPNSIVVMQRQPGTLNSAVIVRQRLQTYFRPADFQNTTSAWVDMTQMNLAVNHSSFVYLDKGVSINETLNAQVWFRAAGGATALVNPVNQ